MLDRGPVQSESSRTAQRMFQCRGKKDYFCSRIFNLCKEDFMGMTMSEIKFYLLPVTVRCQVAEPVVPCGTGFFHVHKQQFIGRAIQDVDHVHHLRVWDAVASLDMADGLHRRRQLQPAAPVSSCAPDESSGSGLRWSNIDHTANILRIRDACIVYAIWLLYNSLKAQ